LKDIYEYVAKLTVLHAVNLGMKTAKQLNQAMIKHLESNNSDQSTLNQELRVAREMVVNEFKKNEKGK
jgi:hypothetical protein